MRRVLVPALEALPGVPPPGSAVVGLAGATMGTTWSVKLALRADAPLAQIERGIQAQLDLVVAQMSTWAPDSNLSRFNSAAPNTWQALPREFFTVLDFGLQVARATGGAYDPTAGALVNLWGFGPAPRSSAPPDAQAIAAAQARGGWERLRLDPPNRGAWQPGGMYVDLSSIAKGYGVDQVARYLTGLGLRSWLVEVGGELRGQGIRPDDQPWWVELEAPPGAQGLATVVALHELAVATSGDYRRWFEADGRRYSHTLDPRSGAPVQNDLASVTVLHSECMAADALATALTVLGFEEGMAYARAHDLPALFVRRTEAGYVEQLSPALARMEN